MMWLQISVASGGSGGSSGGGSTGGTQSQDPEEDLWGQWGRLVNDWETWQKKKSLQLKVGWTLMLVFPFF